MHSGISNSWQMLSRLNHARQYMSMLLPSSFPVKLSRSLCISLRLEQCMKIQRLLIHKRLHLKIVINSKKSEGTRSNTFETSIQEGSSSGQWKSCARFVYPEALRAAMICVLHSTNDYFPGERQLTWVAAGAVDLSRLRNWTCRGFCGVILP